MLDLCLSVFAAVEEKSDIEVKLNMVIEP